MWVEKMRGVIRRQHKALATEDAYCGWLRRYLRFLCSQPVAGLTSEAMAELFLTHLAKDLDVSASTQNGAFNAIRFFYADVVNRPLQDVDALRATRPATLRHAPSLDVTRRVIVPQPPEWVKAYSHEENGAHFFCERDADDDMMRHWPSYETGLPAKYRVGDICYLREPIFHGHASGTALYNDCGSQVLVRGSQVEWRWKRDVLSQMLMPRECARTFCQIVAVRAERVQEISEADAIREGVNNEMPFLWRSDEWQNVTPSKARFAGLWDSINAKRDGGRYAWQQNPWVWVIAFKRLEVANG